MGLFRIALQQRHVPITNQRELVARALFEAVGPVCAEDIVASLETRGQHVSKATVYRTLGLLVDTGFATEHDFSQGFKRFTTRAGPARRDHCICTACGTVTQLRHEEIQRLQTEIELASGFQVLKREFKLYGLCSCCASSTEEIREAS